MRSELDEIKRQLAQILSALHLSGLTIRQRMEHESNETATGNDTHTQRVTSPPITSWTHDKTIVSQVNVAETESTETVTTSNTSATNTSPTNDNISVPNTNEMLAVIIQTQQQLAETLRQTTRPLHVHSTSDTSATIPLFEGDTGENIKEWLKNVDRVSELANWTPNLTLLNATS